VIRERDSLCFVSFTVHQSTLPPCGLSIPIFFFFEVYPCSISVAHLSVCPPSNLRERDMEEGKEGKAREGNGNFNLRCISPALRWQERLGEGLRFGRLNTQLIASRLHVLRFIGAVFCSHALSRVCVVYCLFGCLFDFRYLLVSPLFLFFFFLLAVLVRLFFFLSDRSVKHIQTNTLQTPFFC
jgi:hypothetical protein